MEFIGNKNRKTWETGNTCAKIPNPQKILKSLSMLIRGGWRNRLWLTASYKMDGSFLNLLLKGLIKNLIELKIAITCPEQLSDIVTLTRSSIFGLINFQEKHDPVDIDYDELIEIMKRHLGDAYYLIEHFLEQPSHYVWEGDNVKLCDYGDSTFIEVARKYRTQIKDALEEICNFIPNQSASHS